MAQDLPGYTYHGSALGAVAMPLVERQCNTSPSTVYIYSSTTLFLLEFSKDWNVHLAAVGEESL